MTLSYAIDFGTTNTVITRWNSVNQQSELVSLPGVSTQIGNNLALIPSLLYLEDAQAEKVFLGEVVRNKRLDLKNDPRFFSSFKRGIGASIQGFLPEIDQTKITFEKLGSWFFREILQGLENQVGETPQSLVLTVPVDSFESYRHWLTGLCQEWSIDEIKIIDEPTAAALGYGTGEADTVLVVDFGGGTADFSLVELDNESNKTKTSGFILKLGGKFLGKNPRQKERKAKVLAKVGKNLGGNDLDAWLVDYFAETQGLPQSSLINRLCERLKIKLSQQENATEVYFDDLTLTSYELSLDRKTFESILAKHEFFSQLDELMNQILQQARGNGINKNKIDAVLLVGGTAQIPAVKTWIEKYFPLEKIKGDRPFDAIASGALQLTQGIQVIDFLYHSYGIRYWNRQTQAHSWQPLIRSGQPYPMTQPQELILGASVANQPSVELIIGELGSDTGATEVYFDGNRLITRSLKPGQTQVQPLNDQPGATTIAQLDPLGNPGSDRLKVKFWVDEQRFLRITVEDLLTDKNLLTNQIVAQLS